METVSPECETKQRNSKLGLRRRISIDSIQREIFVNLFRKNIIAGGAQSTDGGFGDAFFTPSNTPFGQDKGGLHTASVSIE